MRAKLSLSESCETNGDPVACSKSKMKLPDEKRKPMTSRKLKPRDGYDGGIKKPEPGTYMNMRDISDEPGSVRMQKETGKSSFSERQRNQGDVLEKSAAKTREQLEKEKKRKSRKLPATVNPSILEE